MTTPRIIERTQGDTAAWEEDTLLDGDGVAINLTGATVKFSLWQGTATPVLNKVSCTVNGTPTTGKVTPAPTTVQNAAIVAGTYKAEYEITYADATIQTVPTSRTKITVIVYPQGA